MRNKTCSSQTKEGFERSHGNFQYPEDVIEETGAVYLEMHVKTVIDNNQVELQQAELKTSKGLFQSE